MHDNKDAQKLFEAFLELKDTEEVKRFLTDLCTPAEVKAFFNRIPKDSLPYFSSEVEVREIVMKPEVNAEQDRLAREKLEAIRKRVIEGGENFTNADLDGNLELLGAVGSTVDVDYGVPS